VEYIGGAGCVLSAARMAMVGYWCGVNVSGGATTVSDCDGEKRLKYPLLELFPL
jgi:hypothetical protein